MTTYVENNPNDIIYNYEGKDLNVDQIIESLSFPEIPFTFDFNMGLNKEFYGITPAYWQSLNIMYNLVNSEEIKKFISQNNDDLKILLLYIPIFVQKHFSGDIISLEVVDDPDIDKKILKALIHTSLPPSEVAEKLDIIDDLTDNLETIDILDNFLLNVEFK